MGADNTAEEPANKSPRQAGRQKRPQQSAESIEQRKLDRARYTEHLNVPKECSYRCRLCRKNLGRGTMNEIPKHLAECLPLYPTRAAELAAAVPDLHLIPSPRASKSSSKSARKSASSSRGASDRSSAALSRHSDSHEKNQFYPRYN